MNVQFAQKKQALGTLFGMAAGVFFSLTTWGVDAVELSKAHLSNPFSKFLPGFFICLLAGCLVGWLSIRAGNTWVSLLLWLAFSGLLVWLVIWLPTKGAALSIAHYQPNLTYWIEYPPIDNLQQFKIIASIIIVIPCVLCALLENNLVETGLLSSHLAPKIGMVLVCGLIMGVSGFGADELLNKLYREPAQALDNLFQFALENYGKEIEPTIARKTHYSVVKDFGDLVVNPRRLTLIAHDQTMGQMDFFVDFKGTWLRCTVIYSQPTRCVPVRELSLKHYLSDFELIFSNPLKKSPHRFYDSRYNIACVS